MGAALWSSTVDASSATRVVGTRRWRGGGSRTWSHRGAPVWFLERCTETVRADEGTVARAAVQERLPLQAGGGGRGGTCPICHFDLVACDSELMDHIGCCRECMEKGRNLTDDDRLRGRPRGDDIFLVEGQFERPGAELMPSASLSLTWRC